MSQRVVDDASIVPIMITVIYVLVGRKALSEGEVHISFRMVIILVMDSEGSDKPKLVSPL